MGVFEELQRRGLVHQFTSEELPGLLERERVTVYVGFDPSAPSLHVGSLVPLTVLLHFQRYGHKVIVVIGGATGLIGDPSGKSAERPLQDADEVRRNAGLLRAQIASFLRTDDPERQPLFVDNLEWLGRLLLIDFLRDTGKHFSVNQMIARDSVRTRFESRDEGISYTEFTYMLLQAYDFLELHRRYRCRLQCGASDQWGNIVSGVDLIRRADGAQVFGLTAPLLTNSEGKKYGKTEKGAVFLDRALTSPYAFYQFWINTADADVMRFLRWFSLRGEEELAELERAVGSPERAAQRALAVELTARVHGEEEAERAVRASAALFGGDVRGLPVATLREIFADVPSVEVPRARFEGEGASLVDLLVETGACSSKGDARRQLAQGAVRVNGELIGATAAEPRVTAAQLLDGQLLVLRRGKKSTYLVQAI